MLKVQGEQTRLDSTGIDESFDAIGDFVEPSATGADLEFVVTLEKHLLSSGSACLAGGFHSRFSFPTRGSSSPETGGRQTCLRPELRENMLSLVSSRWISSNAIGNLATLEQQMRRLGWLGGIA